MTQLIIWFPGQGKRDFLYYKIGCELIVPKKIETGPQIFLPPHLMIQTQII
jgi:hypothetical protein